MDQKTKEILSAMLDMVGQDCVRAACGSDFDPEDCEFHGCEDLWDCQRQAAKVEQTQKIKEMIWAA